MHTFKAQNILFLEKSLTTRHNQLDKSTKKLTCNEHIELWFVSKWLQINQLKAAINQCVEKCWAINHSPKLKSIKKARKNKTRDFIPFSLSHSHISSLATISLRVDVAFCYIFIVQSRTNNYNSFDPFSLSLTHRERCNQHIYKSEICLATLCHVEMKNVISLELMAGFLRI